MRERQLEGLYRSRFEQRRNADDALHELYDEFAAGRDSVDHAWLVIVAQPRIPIAGRQLDVASVRAIVRDTETRALGWAPREAGVHPLEEVNRLNPRRGLRRWMLVNSAEGSERWRESWMAVHDSGAVSLAHAIGGHRIVAPDRTMSNLRGSRIRSYDIECCVADFMALLRETTSLLRIASEYDLVLGIEWGGSEPLVIETVDHHGHRFDGTSIPLSRYTKVRSAVRLDVDDEGFRAQAYTLAQDAVNQGGVQNMTAIQQST